jgi:hypothetical protein
MSSTGTLSPGQTVNSLITTTTTLVSSANPSNVGQSVTFTATITPASGTVAPTGSVQFKVDNVALGTPVTATPGTGSNGTAAISTSDITAAGSPHAVSAEFTASGGFVSSTGTLTPGQTVSNLTQYDLWAQAKGLTSGNNGAGDDPDGDGMTNQQEFAFGLNPMDGSSLNPIAAPLDKATGKFSYTRNATSGLNYTVWTSTNLSGWVGPADVTENVGPVIDGVVTVEVTLTAPPAGDKMFVRVQAD